MARATHLPSGGGDIVWCRCRTTCFQPRKEVCISARSQCLSSCTAPACRRRWDKHGNKLIDSEPKVRFAQLPVLWITGSLATSGASKTSYYTCPCYKAPRRTGLNFVTSVDLRIEDNPSKWVLRGVALLTSTD